MGLQQLLASGVSFLCIALACLILVALSWPSEDGRARAERLLSIIFRGSTND
ncbi:hypothetical protein [Streptomyces sp. bgisy027]|uniref:hypothetical protein n=1 Tax=Streptomyces sp. bgisy027 TaxID=3413770 RepID=UPI003D719984